MEILTFLTVSAVLAIEPLRLAITIPAGLIARRQETPYARWTVIFLGGAIAAGVFGFISTRFMGAEKFPWAQSIAAGMLQGWLVCLVSRRWSRASSAV